MDIIGLIKNALAALTIFLELKSKAFYYDMMEKSRNTQTNIINEIEKLRNDKSSNSTFRADLLREQLKDEKQFAEHLSAAYSPFREK
jgi:hypothetical protein